MLRINTDVAVARKRQYVKADVLDLAEAVVAPADGLAYELAVFGLSPWQRGWQRMLQLIQSGLEEEHPLQGVVLRCALKCSSDPATKGR